MVLTKVEINNVDVSSYIINYEIEETSGTAITSVDMTLSKNVSDVVTITLGTTLEIWRGFAVATEEKVFDGYIEMYEPDQGVFKIRGKDKLWDLQRKQVTKEYVSDSDPEAGVISEIFEDLVTTYGGLTADSTTIQDSGTEQIIKRFRCNHSDIFERCKALAIALDWQFYYKANTDKVYFEPEGYTENSLILTVGSNVIGLPLWENDTSDMVNDLTVVGAHQEIETTEDGQIGVTVGYTTTGIDVDFTPISVKVYADSSTPPTTLRVGGQPDSTGSYYYYVDKPRKKILPAVGTTFTNNWYFEIRYSHQVPIPINGYNQQSIDDYGRFEKTITLTDVQSVVDAEARGMEYLGKFSQPFVTGKLMVEVDSGISYNVGDLIRVVDNYSPEAVDGTFVVVSRKRRYPSDYDEIIVGDREWRLAAWQEGVEDRLKRLMEEHLQNQDILVQRIEFDNTLDNQISKEPIYRKVLTQTIEGTNLFILGDPDYGKLGTGQLGDTDMGAETLHFVQQYGNAYTENFTDTDFKDTANTTATWTGTGSVTFTAAQIARSESIDYNNGTITTAKLTSTEESGSFVYEMTADGSNWESVTNGVPKTFINSGSDLRWRATENNGSTGEISKILIEDYH